MAYSALEYASPTNMYENAYVRRPGSPGLSHPPVLTLNTVDSSVAVPAQVTFRVPPVGTAGIVHVIEAVAVLLLLPGTLTVIVNRYVVAYRRVFGARTSVSVFVGGVSTLPDAIDTSSVSQDHDVVSRRRSMPDGIVAYSTREAAGFSDDGDCRRTQNGDVAGAVVVVGRPAGLLSTALCDVVACCVPRGLDVLVACDGAIGSLGTFLVLIGLTECDGDALLVVVRWGTRVDCFLVVVFRDVVVVVAWVWVMGACLAVGRLDVVVRHDVAYCFVAVRSSVSRFVVRRLVEPVCFPVVWCFVADRR
ncbi:Uncharacterized protein PBTT_10326 [Plasmodiophora brassicae]